MTMKYFHHRSKLTLILQALRNDDAYVDTDLDTQEESELFGS